MGFFRFCPIDTITLGTPPPMVFIKNWCSLWWSIFFKFVPYVLFPGSVCESETERIQLFAFDVSTCAQKAHFSPYCSGTFYFSDQFGGQNTCYCMRNARPCLYPLPEGGGLVYNMFMILSMRQTIVTHTLLLGTILIWRHHV